VIPTYLYLLARRGVQTNVNRHSSPTYEHSSILMCRTTSSSNVSTKNYAINRLDTKLRYIYIITTCLCIFMVTWIIIAPGTAFVNSEKPGWRDKLVSEMNASSTHLPPKLLTKYEGQTLVAYTHIFPAAVWAMAVPLQFHPLIRKKYRTFHKFLGRVFVYTSFLLMIGFVIILHRGLSYENYLEGVEPIVIPGTSLRCVDAGLYMLAARFLYCAVVAVDFAKKKVFDHHQYWMIKHCSMGMWVIIQRFLGILISQWYGFVYGQYTASAYYQGRLFLVTGVLGIIASVAIGQYAILLLKKKDVLVKSE